MTLSSPDNRHQPMMPEALGRRVCPEPPAEPPIDIGADGRYQARVVVADDDPAMRQMVARSLRRAGYDVAEVSSGDRLLRYLGDQLLSHWDEPDLIVSDIRMPGVSGLDVLAGLRRSSWAMPVVLITAFGDARTHDEAARLGAQLLDKPFELDDLLDTVRSIVPPRF